MTLRLWVLAALVAAPAAGHAQGIDCTDAGALLADASRLYDDGKLDAALEIYQRCHRETGRAEFAINSAVVLLKLGRRADGANLLESALNGEDVPADKRAALEATLAQLRKKLGRIRVTSASPGTIAIDGQVVSQNARDATRLVEPGHHEVSRTGGPRRQARQTTVDPGETVLIEFSGPVVAAASRPAERTVVRHPAPDLERQPGPWTLVARLDVAPLDAGGLGVLGAAVRVGERWRLGMSGLLGARVGAEAEVAFALFAGARWRVHAIAATPVFWDDGLYPGGRGAGALALGLGSWSFELAVGAAYAFRTPTSLERLTELVSFSIARAI